MTQIRADYIIVGAGLTGATIARSLFDRGLDVVVLERRKHIGGNIHDSVHPSGIPVHTYGPHFFRAESKWLWDYVHQFGRFYEHQWKVQSQVEEKLEQWPVTQSYIEKTCGRDWRPDFTGVPRNFEEACLARMPRVIYDRFVKGYTEKQWGVPACSLDPGLAGRFEIRDDNDARFKLHRYQGLPLHGYAALMETMLASIPVVCSFDYLRHRSHVSPRKLLIYTGAIDEFFGFSLGRLAYRAQRRMHEHHPDIDFAQAVEAVNIPGRDEGGVIRRIEWKRIMPPEYASRIHGTIISTETPYTPTDPDAFEYPFPDESNSRLYQQYCAIAKERKDVLFCGRLGEYRYYDMDQAVERALQLSSTILQNCGDARETVIIELDRSPESVFEETSAGEVQLQAEKRST